MASIGVGSFLFHTFANRWSLLADVVPIMVFIHGYFLLAMRRFFRLGLGAALAATAAFVAFNIGFVRAWEALIGTSGLAKANGSVGYVPAALALLGVGGLLMIRSRRAERVSVGPMDRSAAATDETGRALLRAAAVFALSLAVRSVDRAVCGWLPLGTHFLWHALNAAVLFMLVKTAIQARAP